MRLLLLLLFARRRRRDERLLLLFAFFLQFLELALLCGTAATAATAVVHRCAACRRSRGRGSLSAERLQCRSARRRRSDASSYDSLAAQHCGDEWHSLLTKPIAPVCVQAGLCSSGLASGSKAVLRPASERSVASSDGGSSIAKESVSVDPGFPVAHLRLWLSAHHLEKELRRSFAAVTARRTAL